MEEKKDKQRISEILVKYCMPTRQIAINEIVKELDRAREEGFRIMFEGLDNIARNSSEDFYEGVAIIKLRNEITRLYKLTTK